MTLKELEKKLGHQFQNQAFLNRALTRKAYCLEQRNQGNNCDDQEIYRTLGDAILKAILTDLLIQSGCNSRHEITIKKIELEREENLAQMSRSIGVGAFLKLGVGEQKQRANEQPYVLAETFEALMGAIYLDSNFDTAKAVVIKLFGESLK